MRTAITLAERPIAQLTRRAAEQGTSVSKLGERAVRRHNIDKTSALLEADDRDRFASGG